MRTDVRRGRISGSFRGKQFKIGMKVDWRLRCRVGFQQLPEDHQNDTYADADEGRHISPMSQKARYPSVLMASF